MDPKFRFYEIVQVQNQYEITPMRNQEGAVLGMSTDDQDNWSYAVYMYDLHETWHFNEDDLQGTGKMDKQETFYDGASIRVSTDDQTGADNTHVGLECIMKIENMISHIKNLSTCVVYPPAGLPSIDAEHHLPVDLAHFYHMCGGVEVFTESSFPTRLSVPSAFVLANPVIFKGVPQEDIDATMGDPSWSWYIIGYGPNQQYITVDLHPNRLGRYYNSHWIKHPRNSEIIAHSITELLEKLLSTQGAYYWFDD